MAGTRLRKTVLVVSAAVVAIAVLGALLVLLVPAAPEQEPSAVAPTASPAPSTPTPAAGVGCDAAPSDDRAVPTDLRWAASQGVTWPVSDSTGPTATVDGLPACFEHSPIGAAFGAVTTLYAQIDHSPQDVGGFYLAASPGRDAALAALGSATSTLKDDLEANGLVLVGFQIEEYDQDRAAVRLVLRVPNSLTGYRGLPYPMVWIDGDWKVKPLDDGSTGQASDVRDGEFTYWTASANG